MKNHWIIALIGFISMTISIYLDHGFNDALGFFGFFLFFGGLGRAFFLFVIRSDETSRYRPD